MRSEAGSELMDILRMLVEAFESQFVLPGGQTLAVGTIALTPLFRAPGSWEPVRASSAGGSERS